MNPPTLTNSASWSSLCDDKHIDPVAADVLNKGKGFSFDNAARTLGLLGEQSTAGAEAEAEGSASQTSLGGKSDASSFTFVLPANSRARTKSASGEARSPRKSSGNNDGDDSCVSNDEDDGIYFKVSCSFSKRTSTFAFIIKAKKKHGSRIEFPILQDCVQISLIKIFRETALNQL